MLFRSQAEHLNGGKVGHEANAESQDVCQSGDGDGHGCLFVCAGHSGRHGVLDLSLLPVRHHDEHIINANS